MIIYLKQTCLYMCANLYLIKNYLETGCLIVLEIATVPKSDHFEGIKIMLQCAIFPVLLQQQRNLQQKSNNKRVVICQSIFHGYKTRFMEQSDISEMSSS